MNDQSQPFADGWHALPKSGDHTVWDGLWRDGECVATVEAFSVTGPWYPWKLLADDQWHRGGAFLSYATAVAWAEKPTLATVKNND